jgi:hypothetical protein
MIKRKQLIPVYGGHAFTETWTRNGQIHTEHSATAALDLERGGIVALERLATMPGIAKERRSALTKIVERIKGNLVEKEVEREVRAYSRLSESEARREWNAELAAAPKTHVQHVHLLTGALLPIWDRIPGSPRVIRTQTDAGERLLGRTVVPALLAQTLKNLGVGSDVSKLLPEMILARIQAGTKAVLANGWEIATARVSNETRIEIQSATMSENERRMLTQQGAFCERIQWRDRVFIPTGENALVVLARVLESKPVAELFDRSLDEPAPGPVFCQSEHQVGTPPETSGNHEAGLDLAALTRATNSIRSTWPGVPPIVCVQSTNDLPFPALSTTQGAFHRDTIYLVADNIADDDDLQFVVGHEALGHAGLRAILDQESLSREMARLRDINPDLDRAARKKVEAIGCNLDLGTEEALCDLAGSGRRINGLQQLVLMIQRGLRMVGLDKLADWFESRSQSETMDLLRLARAAVLERPPRPQTLGAPCNAVFALKDHEHDQVESRVAAHGTTAGDTEAAETPRFTDGPALSRVASERPDPFGLRAFGLRSLNQVGPAYRDTSDWRSVPEIMSTPRTVDEICADLARIEDERGGMFTLNENGNIVIVNWNPRTDNQSVMKTITALADRHGLGVLTKKSAFISSVENYNILRSHGFTIVGGGVTRAATGRDGPPNSVTFVRRPTGAPLFSHAPGDMHETAATLLLAGGKRIACALATRPEIYRGPTAINPVTRDQRRTRVSPSRRY